MPGYKTILSLDGGGIRGVIAARILVEIEERTGKPIHELFDLVAGTSTGGILAVGLTKGSKPLSAECLLKLYTERGDKIFSRSLWRRATTAQGLTDERYDAKPLESILLKLLGNAELKTTRPDIIVTSYDIEERKPYYFKTSKARHDSSRNHLLRHVARATSAGPTFFEPLLLDSRQWRREKKTRALIDGGVFANNPSMIGVSEALTSGAGTGEILLCSIGTGTNNRPILYSEARDWGMLGWVEPVISVMMDGMSDSADYLAEQMLPPVDGQQRYFRFDRALEGASDDLDDATPRNINGLLRVADAIIRENDDKLTSLVAQLSARHGNRKRAGRRSQSSAKRGRRTATP